MTNWKSELCSLVDSHIHLQDYEIGTNIGELIDEAISSGVSCMVCNGTEVDDWQIVQGFSEKYPQVVPCFGVHPWFVNRLPSDWEDRLEHMLQSVKSGVGEIGLDRNVEDFDRELQEEIFRRQLALAVKYDRPATIHCVKSWGWMMDVLRSENALPHKMLFHSYGGPSDLIPELTKMGAFFSYSGKVLFTNYLRARRSLLEVPPERLLIETDAPCMVPPSAYVVRSLKSSDGYECNLPANLPLILQGISELLNEEMEHLKERLSRNSRIFFGGLLE